MKMRARAVDWALFFCISFEFLSGFVSFLVGKPEGRPLFVVHGAVGLAIIVLLAWKFRRVYRRVAEPRRWQWATVVSVMLSLAALAALLTGITWTVFQKPVNYPNGMILHTTAGIALAVLYLWHMLLRYKPLSHRDVTDRRTVFSFLGALALGGLAWTAQDRTVRALDAPGAARRFTGSRHAGPGTGNAAFPVTMWMLDNPAPLNGETYRLSVSGAVAMPQSYRLAQLATLPATAVDATLDCTGGWYTDQQWRGIRVSTLLAEAGVDASARFVSFVSATGYRWSLPLEEAQHALLATHVGGEALSHGHGAPLRLVAPGRRGFQWVKWVVQIEVTPTADFGQWHVIFTSGLR
jgi:DMSO/TMAO reductase YedYZ molybdopterin-dependent catalytic subunit